MACPATVLFDEGELGMDLLKNYRILCRANRFPFRRRRSGRQIHNSHLPLSDP